MPTQRSWLRLALGLMVFLSIASCGGQEAGDATAEPRGNVPGAPLGQPDDAEAPGAPITVPTIAFAKPPSLDEAREAIEQRIREQCGGELCVDVVVEQRDLQGVTACDFAGLEPEPGTRVQRDSTIVIVSGAQPCDGASAPEQTEEYDGEEEQNDDLEDYDDPEAPEDDTSQPPSTP